MSTHDDDVSDSEGARIDAWDLANEHRWAGPGWTVTLNGIESDYLYTYTPKDGGEITHIRPPMHPGYEPLPKPGMSDTVVPAFPATQVAASDDDEEELDATQGLLNPSEFGHHNVAEDYRHAITTYGQYDANGAAALIMHFQKKVTAIEARIYAERDSVTDSAAWQGELELINQFRDDVTFLDDVACEMDDYRRYGGLHDESYVGWADKVGAGTPSARYERAKAEVLAMEDRAPWPLLAMAADLYETMREQHDAYTAAVEGRKWDAVPALRDAMGLEAAERICREKTSDTAEEASPWYKEQDELEAANSPDERYIRALRTGASSIAQARQALSSRKDKREQLAKQICTAQMGLAEDDAEWVARIEAELQQLSNKKRSSDAVSVVRAPATKKKARCGGGAMAAIVGSKRAVGQDVRRRRPARADRQQIQNGMVMYRTDEVCINPKGERRCVDEAWDFAIGSNKTTRLSLGLPARGDVDFRKWVHAINTTPRSPFRLRKSAPCRWSTVLSKPPGIYIFRVLLKDGNAHYMAIDTGRMLLFAGGAAPPPAPDAIDQFLYYDARRPEDYGQDLARLFLIEDDEVAHPEKFEAWVKTMIDVTNSGIDNMYSVHLVVKHARGTGYNTPEHFDQ